MGKVRKALFKVDLKDLCRWIGALRLLRGDFPGGFGHGAHAEVLSGDSGCRACVRLGTVRLIINPLASLINLDQGLSSRL